MDNSDPAQVPKCEQSNPNAQIPAFPTLIGEHPLLISKTADGNAMVTNFRFCACERRSFINIPLMMVSDLVVIEAAKRLRIGCKDGSTYICTFATTEDCTSCTSLLKEKTGQPQNKMALFAYRFYKSVMHKKSLEKSLTKAEEEQIQLCDQVSQQFAYSFGKEVERLGFDTNRRKIWRMCNANEHFEFCPTYPKTHILPATVDDDKLKISLDFRALRRFPSVIWRDKKTGMVLIRSSQPLSSFLGVSYFTNHADVYLIEEIVNACNKDFLAINQKEQRRTIHPTLPGSEVPNRQGHGEGNNLTINSQKEDGAQGSLVCDDPGGANGHGASNGSSYFDDDCTPKKLAIVDCRSLAGVWGNSFKGGGTEDEVVYKCSTIHLDLANIHTVRDSFNKLRAMCHTYVEGTYYKSLAGCMWPIYINALLRGANIVVELMHVMKRPVLVHCSDGWDRTSQIVSLSELMMDPYYRTLEGFQVLVEREWLHFGHKFGERGGYDPNCNDTNQISPIFLQFLDCVYQLTYQHPSEFQFNEAYLVKLLQNSQSCLFGTFLYNCQKERENCQNKTASVWSLLRTERSQFVNLLYKPTEKVFTAKICEHDIALWKSVYMAGLSPTPHVSQTDFCHEPNQSGVSGDESLNPASDGIPRSKSMDDLSKTSIDSGRRNSDPNLSQSQEIASSPVLSSLHNNTVSAELLSHFQEDSSNLIPKPNQPNQTKDSDKDAMPKMSPNSSASIKQSPNASYSSSYNGDTSAEILVAEGEILEGCATVSSHDTLSNLGLVMRKPHEEKLVDGGLHSELEPSKESADTTDEGNVFLSDNSKAQSLNALSSAVFCQENGSSKSFSEHGMCCDRQVNGLDAKVLSNNTGVCFLENGDCNLDYNCHLNCWNSMDNVTNSSTKFSSCNGLTNSGYNLKQTSLLSERLALTSNLEQNGISQNLHHTLLNGKFGHFYGDDNHHSMKLGNDHPVALKLQAQREVSRKLMKDCCLINSYNKSGEKISTQIIRADVLDKYLYGASPTTRSRSYPALNGVDYTKTVANSISTDTLIGDSECSTSNYSKPLEVSTRNNNEINIDSVPFKTSSALLSSSLKKGHCQSEVSDATECNILSRKAKMLLGTRKCMLSNAEKCNGNSYVVQLASTVVDRQPSIAQHIDVDGLTMFCDERQDRLAEVVAALNQKILHLEHHLNEALSVIQKSCKGCNHLHQQSQVLPIDDLTMDSDGGDRGSLGAISNASDTSWETIDEHDSMIVTWIPDTAVTHCAGCESRFSVYRRKHHCRNCGKVFCADCSGFLAPVPHQHLTMPSRVCRRCHSHLQQLSPGASSDGRIPTLVADG